MQINNNEYVNTLKVYMNVVDTLLKVNNSNLCYFTKEGDYANFKVPAFKTLLEQKGRGENYRYYMIHFRIFAWIICQSGKFSNIQRINGKLLRVITIDYNRYLLLKKLLQEKKYYKLLDNFMEAVNQIIYINDYLNKCLYVLTQNNSVLNVRSISYRIILKKVCKCDEEFEECLQTFRDLQWIICKPGSFTNIQKINGKATRVTSIDFKKYKLIKKLLDSY